MNELGIIRSLRDNLFPNGMGESGGLNEYYDIVWPYIAAFAGLIAVITVGVQVATAFVSPNKDLDPYILIRPILVLAAMTCYGSLVNIILEEPAGLLTSITEQVALQVTGAVSISSDKPNESDESDESDDSDESAGSDGSDGSADPGAGAATPEGSAADQDQPYNQTFEKLYMDQLVGRKNKDEYDVLAWSHTLEFGHLLVQILAMLVALYIMVRQVLLLGVYYVLGIFVLPFSLIPGNQEIIKKWFFGFLAVFLWLPVLRILQTIIILIDFQSVGGGTDTILASLMLQICAVFFILATPKFANMLVSGSGDNDSSGWAAMFTREAYYRRARSKGASPASGFK